MRSYIGWQIYDYYQWLLDKIDGFKEPYYDYSLLLNKLHSMPFVWSIERDENRAMDGINLRWEYMDENNIPDIFYKEGIKCSVLEMLISLSIRCDQEIIGEAGINQVPKWFWIMIDNLDLMKCTDDNFSGEYVEQQINTWLNRVFSRSGKGSPFPLKKAYHDQRKVEIWFQMCGYLSENF